MKTHIAYRNFTMCKAALLVALIGASALIAPFADAKRHPVAKAVDTLDYGSVPEANGVIRINAVVSPGGDVLWISPMKATNCPKSI